MALIRVHLSALVSAAPNQPATRKTATTAASRKTSLSFEDFILPSTSFQGMFLVVSTLGGFRVEAAVPKFETLKAGCKIKSLAR
jgi:hypothetical protein